MTLDQFEELLKTAVDTVCHFDAFKRNPPYVIWAEYKDVYKYADNKPYTGFTRVQVDYYTGSDKDPAVKQIKQLLADNGIPFSWLVRFEGDEHKKLLHHVYDCEVIL